MVERCRLRVCVPGNPTCWRHHEQGTGQEFYCRQTPYVSMRESFAEQLRKFKRNDWVRCKMRGGQPCLMHEMARAGKLRDLPGDAIISDFNMYVDR